MYFEIEKGFTPTISSKFWEALNKTKDRKLQFDQFMLDRYLKNANATLNVLNPIEKIRLNSHISALTNQRHKEGRYTQNVLGLDIDEKNEIEKAGVGEYARNYTLVYSFEDSLDLIISTIFNCDQKRVRYILNKRAKELDMDYISVSRAVLTQNEPLLNRMGFSLFIGLSEVLDRYLSFIYENIEKNKLKDFNGNEIDFSNVTFNSIEEKFSAMFYAVLLKYASYLTDCLIAKFYIPLRDRNRSEIILASKGLSNLVIYSNVMIEEKAEVQIGDKKVVLLPQCSKKDSYYKLVHNNYAEDIL